MSFKSLLCFYNKSCCAHSFNNALNTYWDENLWIEARY